MQRAGAMAVLAARLTARYEASALEGTGGFSMTTANQRSSRIKGLHHNAYHCRDSEETRKFYEDVRGMVAQSKKT